MPSLTSIRRNYGRPLPGATEFETDIATLEAVIRASEDRRRALNKNEKQFMFDLRSKARQG